MRAYRPELYHTTYEYESNLLNPLLSPYNQPKNHLFKISQERLSNSPPIILCETGGSRNNKTHRHRYLFYPSASRLSPFTDNNFIGDVNIIKNYPRGENNKEREISNKNNLINKNETALNQNEKSPEKYQAMYDKSFQLVKRISELVPEDNIKVKGNPEYYLEKDKDYMNIIDKEINTLTNHFKNNNFNLGYKTDGNIYNSNNKNIFPEDENQLTYDEYKKNLLQRIKTSNTGINPDEYNYNYKQKDNIEENKDFKNNYENEIDNNNRNYIDDYINVLKAKNKNNDNKNVEINEPEIQSEANLKYTNKKINKMNEQGQKYENKNEENNSNIFKENDQLMKNKRENNLNIIKNPKEEEINPEDKKIKQSAKYNTLGMIQGTNDDFNINPNQNIPYNNINNNKDKYDSQKIKGQEDDQNLFYPYQLIEENSNQIILSSDNKPFFGELIDNQYQKGNQIFIKTKSGETQKLSILRGKEGEPLTYQGYPLMGTDNKFFYDKNKNIIVYPDNEFIKGDKSIKVGIQDIKNKKAFMGFIIDKNTNSDFGGNTGEEFRGSGSGGFKKSKRKNKWYMFPKGDGDAKAPVIKKRKKRKNKI